MRYSFSILLVLILHAVSAEGQAPAITAANKYVNDEKNWKWGIFYYCPQDKTMFPPKQSGLGWTINLGNPNAIGIAVAGLAILIIAGRYYKKHVEGKS